MNQRFIVWGLIILGLFAVVLAIIGIVTRSSSNVAGQLAVPVNDSDWFLGGKEAKTVLVEYSDFECSACAFYAPIVGQLGKNFGDEIKIIYRHFPLPQHQNAKLAAKYAEAAGKQNKFWQMTEAIFNGQRQWMKSSAEKIEEDYFLKYAAGLDLNIEKLKIDLTSQEVNDKIENDIRGGEMSKISYTPTFFLNGEKIENPRSYEDFKLIIEGQLNK